MTEGIDLYKLAPVYKNPDGSHLWISPPRTGVFYDVTGELLELLIIRAGYVPEGDE